MPMYSDKVMEHFMKPRNVGEINDPDGVGEIGNPTCGDMMTFMITVKDDKLADVKFKTFGCGAAIAVSSMVSEMATGKTLDGVAGDGPVILAVDFLPCELPVDSSNFFSRALSPFVPALARADFSRALADSGLPSELQRATIVYRGGLTEPYRYLREYLG